MLSNPYNLTTLAVSLGGLCFVIWGPLQWLRRDAFRSDIRSLRDGLFDYMLERGYSFDTKSYRDTRQLLNGMIRTSNWLTPANAIVGLLLYKHYDMGTDTAEFTSYDDCPGELREKLKAVAAAAISRMVVFMFVEGAIGVAMRTAFFLLNQSQKIDKAVRLMAIRLYPLGAPPEDLSFAQRSLLRC